MKDKADLFGKFFSVLDAVLKPSLKNSRNEVKLPQQQNKKKDANTKR